jgi:predicted amidohydrolase YtcJ
MRHSLPFITVLFAFVFIRCATVPKQAAPDLILFHGNLFTADSSYAQATAIAIGGDRILALGQDEEIKKLAAKNTQIIDLQGNFVMPGFIEGHGHFNGLGRSLKNLNLLYSKNWDEIVAQAAPKVQAATPGSWVEGRGWHQEKWDATPARNVNGYPYHDALSAISPDHPVVLYHASGHALMANAKAMELAWIDTDSYTPDPEGGRIVRDAQGRATGVFEENAMNLIEKPLSVWKQGQTEAQKVAAFEESITLASRHCLQLGITSFQDAGSDFWELGQYRRMAEEKKLGLRLWAMVAQPSASDYSKLNQYPQIGLGDGFFTSRAVKAYFDGALGSYGAWLLAPYSDKPGHVGQNTTPVDTIAAIAAACKQYGLQYCVHAIGDRANRELLDVFEKNMTAGKDMRWRVEHAQHVDPQDIPRFKQLGVIASMQAVHCTSDAPFVVKRLGETRAQTGAYPWRSIIDSGARMANGTDAPVEEVSPLPCLYAAVTRKRTDSGMAFFPYQKMTRSEALLSYTLWNAYAAFEEKDKGSLTPGKYADIIVLDTDLLQCPPEQMLKAKVTKTILAGKEIK